MRGWVLTTVSMASPDPYTDLILPLTSPLFAAYADQWDMDYLPQIISPAEYAEFEGHGTAPRGTAAVYASIPFRRHLLDRYDGVVFMDADTVIMDGSVDICHNVGALQPISTEPACNCATMVLKSCAVTRKMLDHIWDLRHAFKNLQWLEQAAYMEMMGFDPAYPGDGKPPVWRGPTEWTPMRRDLNPLWNVSPFWPCDGEPLSWHPGGVQPFDRRLKMIEEWASVSQLRAIVPPTA